MSLEVEEREKFRFFRLSEEEREKVSEGLMKLVEAHSEVRLAVLFGSFTRNEPFRDVDLAVYVAGVADALDYKFRLDEELSGKLRIPVDVKVLNEAPAWFTLKVLREGKVILERDGGLFEKIYLKALDEKEALEGMAAHRQAH